SGKATAVDAPYFNPAGGPRNSVRTNASRSDGALRRHCWRRSTLMPAPLPEFLPQTVSAGGMLRSAGRREAALWIGLYGIGGRGVGSGAGLAMAGALEGRGAGEGVAGAGTDAGGFGSGGATGG